MADGEVVASEGEVVSEVTELVSAARLGDDAAWRMLVTRYVDLVWTVARGHGLDHCDAADVSQTTWMRLHEQLGHVRQPERIAAWLVTTARRESLRVLRDHRRQVPDPFSSGADFVPSVDGGFDEIEREPDRLLWRAFGSLTPPCQTLLRALSTDPPPSYADLSIALDMPIGSIGPTRSRCLDRLRANLMALSGPARPGAPNGQEPR